MGWFPFLETLAVKADLPTDILKITFALFTVIALSISQPIQVLSSESSQVAQSEICSIFS